MIDVTNETPGETIWRLQSELGALRAENAALKESQRWTPVDERWPEFNCSVLVVSYDGVFDVAWLDDAEDWQCLFGATFKPTHWQPLPPPPKGGE